MNFEAYCKSTEYNTLSHSNSPLTLRVSKFISPLTSIVSDAVRIVKPLKHIWEFNTSTNNRVKNYIRIDKNSEKSVNKV